MAQEGRYRLPCCTDEISPKGWTGQSKISLETETFNECSCHAGKVFNGEADERGIVSTLSTINTYVNTSRRHDGTLKSSLEGIANRPKQVLPLGKKRRSCKRKRVIILLFVMVLLCLFIDQQQTSNRFLRNLPKRADDVIYHQPLTHSQLNGVNGEHTGTDDMDLSVNNAGGKKDTRQLGDLERMRREARNLTKSRSASGDSKRSKKEIQYDIRQKGKKQGGTCADPKSDVLIPTTAVVELKVETFTCYVIPSATHQLYEIQGMAYSAIPHGYNVFSGEEDFVPVRGGDILGKKLLVQSCGIGWFIRSSVDEKNKINYVTSSACTVLCNDGFSYRDASNRLVSCERKEFVIYKPLLANLVKNVRSDALTDFVVKQGAMILTNQSYIVDGLLDHPIMLSTLEAYKYWLFRRGILQNSGQIRKFITMNYDALGYHETQHPLHEEAWIAENHIQIDGHFSPWTEESITTDTLSLLSWEPREDFEIVKNIGVDVTNGRFVFGLDTKYPSRLKVTKFFSFEGLGLVPFNKHTRNNVNLSHGCKRLIGCRGTSAEEKMLRQNAMSLARALVDRSNPYECRILAKSIGKRKLTNVTADARLFTFIKNSFDELKGRVAPHYLARKISEAKTWLHTFKYRALEQYYQHNPFYGRTLWAQIPHAKSKQREEFVGNRHFHYEEYMPLKSMKVCIKDELGKCGKPARLFLNLDTESTYAPTLPMHTKFLLHGIHMYQLSVPHTSNVVIMEVFIYAQPDPTVDEMDWIADKMNRAQFLDNYLFVAIHSDDSIMVGNVCGRKIMCNNDVSSNDAGQDAPVFFGMAALQGLLSERLAEGLLDLACLPIDIRSPTSDGFLRIQFQSPFEPSGHSNTSCWNHLGSLFISLSIFFELVNTDASLSECVSKGARSIGHVMTCEVCEYLEDLQFLKFSPVFVNGECVMSANLGRIFRKIGVVDNDMTHLQLGVDVVEFRVMTPEERMNRFWAGVILGLKHEPSNVILDALRTRFDSSRYKVTESALSLLKDENVDSYYMHNRTVKYGDCTESIMRRYRLEGHELEQLVAVIHDLSVGKRFKLTSIAKMFAKDYGVSHVTDIPSEIAIGTQYLVEGGGRRSPLDDNGFGDPVEHKECS